jgi:TRAP-type C4-dicarboxylate transport system substrate-binding protein
MKKIIIALLVIVLSITLVMVSCGEPEAETFQLKLAHAFPPPSGLGMALENWAKGIGEKTNGRVEITVYGGGSLVKSAEWFDAAVSGVTDISYGHPSEDLSHGALETGFGLPGITWPDEWPNVETRIKIQNEIRDTYPIIDEAHGGAVLLFDVIMPPYVLQSTKLIRVPADMEGTKVAATGFYATVADILKAVPVTMAAPDRYMGLDRGTIAASWDIWGGIFAMKHYEVSDYYLDGPEFGSGMAQLVMNREVFESMPKDIQKIFREEEVILEFPKNAFYGEIALAKNAIAEHNGQIIVPTAEEMALWDMALKTTQAAWVEQMTERGLPAQEFLDDLLSLIKKNS